MYLLPIAAEAKYFSSNLPSTNFLEPVTGQNKIKTF
jgi:hypothetical protein